MCARVAKNISCISFSHGDWFAFSRRKSRKKHRIFHARCFSSWTSLFFCKRLWIKRARGFKDLLIAFKSRYYSLLELFWLWRYGRRPTDRWISLDFLSIFCIQNIDKSSQSAQQWCWWAWSTRTCRATSKPTSKQSLLITLYNIQCPRWPMASSAQAKKANPGRSSIFRIVLLLTIFFCANVLRNIQSDRIPIFSTNGHCIATNEVFLCVILKIQGISRFRERNGRKQVKTWKSGVSVH